MALLPRKIALGVVALVAASGATAGYNWVWSGRPVETTDNAHVEADTAMIASRISGYVASVRVEDNQRIRAGEILMSLQDADYRAKAREALAESDRMRQEAEGAEAQQEGRVAAIREAEAGLAAASAEAERAEAERSRLEPLVARQFVSRRQFEAATADALSRRAAVQLASASLQEARASARTAAAERRAALAAGNAAAARGSAADYDLSNTLILAPFDGVVGNRGVRVGQYVRSGQQLMMVVPIDSAYVVANFKETQIARMRPGQPARIRLDAYPDASITGRVVSLAPAAGSRFALLPPENATGNYTRIVQRIPVRIRLDRPLPGGVRIAAGLSARVSVDVGPRR